MEKSGFADRKEGLTQGGAEFFAEWTVLCFVDEGFTEGWCVGEREDAWVVCRRRGVALS